MNDKKIEYLNSYIKNSKKFTYGGPTKLYKYREFDKYAFEMLEENYVYLCPAKNLDDKSECNTTTIITDYFDNYIDFLRSEAVDQIIEMLKPYTAENNFNQSKEDFIRCYNKDDTLNSRKVLEAYPDIQEKYPDFDIAPFINYLNEIPDMLNQPEYKPQMDLLLGTALDAKNLVGVCSLAESHDIKEMWDKYSKEEGYCIEYDVSDYENNKSILPVIYDDDRKTNIIYQLVGTFIGQMINSISNYQMNADMSQYLRLYLTKNTEWSYQREWRLVGIGGEKPPAPKIASIYLAEKVLEENKNKILEYARIKKIPVYIKKNNKMELIKNEE